MLGCKDFMDCTECGKQMRWSTYKFIGNSTLIAFCSIVVWMNFYFIFTAKTANTFINANSKPSSHRLLWSACFRLDCVVHGRIEILWRFSWKQLIIAFSTLSDDCSDHNILNHISHIGAAISMPMAQFHFVWLWFILMIAHLVHEKWFNCLTHSINDNINSIQFSTKSIDRNQAMTQIRFTYSQTLRPKLP